MCLVGMIKLPKEESDNWIEINSQILNAIFTLNVFITQPLRFLNLVRIIKLRTYFRNWKKTCSESSEILQYVLFVKLATQFPFLAMKTATDDEKNVKLEFDEIDARLKRLFFIIILLNINCLTQYPITGGTFSMR